MLHWGMDLRNRQLQRQTMTVSRDVAAFQRNRPPFSVDLAICLISIGPEWPRYSGDPDVYTFGKADMKRYGQDSELIITSTCSLQKWRSPSAELSITLC